MTRLIFSVACAGVVILLGLAGCGGSPKGMSGQTVSALAGEWVLESIEGGDVGENLPEGARRPSITIGTNGKVTGFGGVNHLSSELNVDAVPKGEFELGPIVSTKMAGPPRAMELESRFTRLLDEAGSFELTGDSLVLLHEGKGPPMRLMRRR